MFNHFFLYSSIFFECSGLINTCVFCIFRCTNGYGKSWMTNRYFAHGLVQNHHPRAHFLRWVFAMSSQPLPKAPPMKVMNPMNEPWHPQWYACPKPPFFRCKKREFCYVDPPPKQPPHTQPQRQTIRAWRWVPPARRIPQIAGSEGSGPGGLQGPMETEAERATAPETEAGPSERVEGAEEEAMAAEWEVCCRPANDVQYRRALM